MMSRNSVLGLFAALLLAVNAANAQVLALLVPTAPASGLNVELARQLLPSAAIQASTARSFAANHRQLIRTADAVLLTSESILEFELENSKISDSYERLKVLAVRPVVLWATARSLEKVKLFDSVEIAVPKDSIGREGSCTDLLLELRKLGRSIRSVRYGDLKFAISQLAGGRLAGVCAPYADTKNPSVRVIFASTEFDPVDGEHTGVFPHVSREYLQGFTEVMAVFVPKHLDDATKGRILQAVDQDAAIRAKSQIVGGWVMSR